MTHTLITSASAWGHRYQYALAQVMKAWEDYRAKNQSQFRGDNYARAVEFMRNKDYRPLVVTLVYHIQDSKLEETDVEDMLVELAEEEE